MRKVYNKLIENFRATIRRLHVLVKIIFQVLLSRKMFYIDWCNIQTNYIVKFRDIIQMDLFIFRCNNKMSLEMSGVAFNVGHTVLNKIIL